MFRVYHGGDTHRRIVYLSCSKTLIFPIELKKTKVAIRIIENNIIQVN